MNKVQEQCSTQLSALEVQTDNDYQAKSGNPNIYMKGIFKVLVLTLRYLIARDSEPRTNASNRRSN